MHIVRGAFLSRPLLGMKAASAQKPNNIAINLVLIIERLRDVIGPEEICVGGLIPTFEI